MSFLADAARFSAKIPYFVAALSAERQCVAAFSADAAKMHKVELYPWDLVHESCLYALQCSRSSTYFSTLYIAEKYMAGAKAQFLLRNAKSVL